MLHSLIVAAALAATDIALDKPSAIGSLSYAMKGPNHYGND